MAAVRKNKNGVKNSLVNNINARKKKGKSRSKKKSTITKKAYSAMKNNWGRTRKRATTSNAPKKGKKNAKRVKKATK